MAKGKALNPADAARKAARKKELKKNKEVRQKTRDFALVKKDTSELEEEIASLESVTAPSKDDKARLSELKSELARVQKKKEEYVEAHPDQRNLVYRRKYDKPKDGGGQNENGGPGASSGISKQKAQRNLFKKNGLPRHPERSIYYDPVMNPYGMPPPGMPYQERALLPGEVDSEAEEDAGAGQVSELSDDDIAMPEGPPPSMEHDADDDDNIPLPEGPPPDYSPLANGNPPLPLGPPPLPPGLPPSTIPMGAQAISNRFISGMPPFFPDHLLNPPPFVPQPFPSQVPPPPPGFFPRSHPPTGAQRTMATNASQDPLSAIPHQPFQGYHVSRVSSKNSAQASTSTLPPPPASLPVKPKLPPSTDATISAEPELRDFKKESTMFVPSALKRRRGGVAKVNAAPPAGVDAEADASSNLKDGAARPDLMGALREKLGPMSDVSSSRAGKGEVTNLKRPKLEKPKDDYDRFMDEISGVLAPSMDT